jgi:hypothetical protein
MLTNTKLKEGKFIPIKGSRGFLIVFTIGSQMAVGLPALFGGHAAVHYISASGTRFFRTLSKLQGLVQLGKLGN